MITVRKSKDRGHANYGWLDSHHTFSFAGYHDSEFMGFRSLRVINEDRVQGGQGFGTHPHSEFEIISYVVSGALKHQDSMGHSAVMTTGDVQRISAGTGILHSEFNHSPTEPVHFLQIWIVPSKKGVKPDYAQKSFSSAPPSALSLACSSDGRSDSIKINQDADVYIGRLDPNEKVTHKFADGRHGWVQLIEGTLSSNCQALEAGDGLLISGESWIDLYSLTGAHFLLFDLL